MSAKETARDILDRADDTAGAAIVDAVNQTIDAQEASRATVILACSQVLAQLIVEAPVCAEAVRSGIIALIDICVKAKSA